jgi:hypothetical protein
MGWQPRGTCLIKCIYLWDVVSYALGPFYDPAMAHSHKSRAPDRAAASHIGVKVFSLTRPFVSVKGQCGAFTFNQIVFLPSAHSHCGSVSVVGSVTTA